MAGWDGLGSAPQKINLQSPGSFSELTKCQPAAASGLPLLVVEQNGLTGACRNALNWSIIDLAREHSNARISRQQGGHCRWQVAAGGERGSHVANKQHVQCGGAGRGSVALTGSRHRRYPRSSFLHEVALGLWSKLWTRFERLSEILKLKVLFA